VELNVQTPEGWQRVKRRDCIEFRRPAAMFTFDQIVGRPGALWSLRLRVGGWSGVKRPVIELRSLKALLVWYEVDKATRDDGPFDPYLEVARDIGVSRGAAKSIIHSYAYGRGFSSAQADAYRLIALDELRSAK